MTLTVDRVQLPLSFSAARLQNDLGKFQDSEWIRHFVEQNYEGNWLIIPLRGPEGETHPIRQSYSDPACEAFCDTEFLARTHYLPTVLKAFKCPLLSVRLMRLSPGSHILEHRDHGLDGALGTLRLHIPIVTNPGVEFRLNGSAVALREGECWYLRLTDPHSVANNGTSDRTHLVIDAQVNGWLRSLIEEATMGSSATVRLTDEQHHSSA